MESLEALELFIFPRLFGMYRQRSLRSTEHAGHSPNDSLDPRLWVRLK